MSRRFRFPKSVDFREVARAVVLLAPVSLLAFATHLAGTANAQTGDLNWPSKQTVRPREIALSYPCGGGTLCDIAAYMDRQHVCALVVTRGGEIVLHRTSVRSDDDPCKSPVARDRYGIASITKSIVSLLFGFVYQD